MKLSMSCVFEGYKVHTSFTIKMTSTVWGIYLCSSSSHENVQNVVSSVRHNSYMHSLCCVWRSGDRA